MWAQKRDHPEPDEKAKLPDSEATTSTDTMILNFVPLELEEK